ncbi:MAG: C-GCAxxG-C-C family (seleno)protein [bacterium]
MNTIQNDTKKVFKKCGTCSHTFFFLLNREFGYPKENEELASDPLAGGLSNQGYQCGMLWGASLAVGAESFRRHDNRSKAIATAITATQQILKSFVQKTNTANCREITGCNLTSIFGMMKLGIKIIVKGMENSQCFNLAADWTSGAIQSAKTGLSQQQTDLSQTVMSCACEVAKKMGANEEEMVMVAGFAGGYGLSGNACGALAAAIWMNTLNWCKQNPGKTPPYFKNPHTKKTMEAFCNETNSNFLCNKITGQTFKTIDDHSEFIKNGGCDKLINVLAQS